jgi:hypothetical protein
MPPTLFALLSFPMTRLAYALFPLPIANGIIAGAFAFYVLYECVPYLFILRWRLNACHSLMHYALHHTQLPKYLKGMKVYHMAHHFKNAEWVLIPFAAEASSSIPQPRLRRHLKALGLGPRHRACALPCTSIEGANIGAVPL